MSDNRGGGGLGFLGAALLLGGWLWWDGHLFAEWTLFVVTPTGMERQGWGKDPTPVEAAIEVGRFKDLGTCQVAASVRRPAPLVEGGAWFCGLGCGAAPKPAEMSAGRLSDVLANGSTDPGTCRRLEPAPH